jgi:hypothetical protein
LAAEKNQGRLHRGQDRLIKAVPICAELLIKAAERVYPLKIVTSNLLRLLECYGSSELEASVKEALQRGVPHPNAVRLSLEKRRDERNQPPPIPIDMPIKRIRELIVRPHSLCDYDKFSGGEIK